MLQHHLVSHLLHAKFQKKILGYITAYIKTNFTYWPQYIPWFRTAATEQVASESKLLPLWLLYIKVSVSHLKKKKKWLRTKPCYAYTCHRPFPHMCKVRSLLESCPIWAGQTLWQWVSFLQSDTMPEKCKEGQCAHTTCKLMVCFNLG